MNWYKQVHQNTVKQVEHHRTKKGRLHKCYRVSLAHTVNANPQATGQTKPNQTSKNLQMHTY
jgi:hypothetical protein